MFQLILIILFALGGLILGVLNPQQVPFNMPGATWQLPLSILLAGALGTGMLLGSLLLAGRLLALSWKVKRTLRKLKQCEAEKLSLKQARILQSDQNVKKNNQSNKLVSKVNEQ